MDRTFDEKLTFIHGYQDIGIRAEGENSDVLAVFQG